MADAFRVCRPFHLISLPFFPWNLLHISDCLFFFVWFYFLCNQAIVTFALSLVDALLFVHYAAVLLLEIRQMPPRYYLHVIRSPDGISRGYPIGAVRIVLSFYYLISIGCLNLFVFLFVSSPPSSRSDIDPAGRRLVAGQVLHGISDLQPVPGAAAAQEEPLKVGPFVLVQILRPGRPEQSRLPPSGT